MERSLWRKIKDRSISYLAQIMPGAWKFYYQRNKWRMWPSENLLKMEDTNIDRPIFFLGLQGGGLSILARILKRHKDVISISGNYKFWTGDDELVNLTLRHLPASLWGPKRLNTLDYHFANNPQYKNDHPIFGNSRNWLYASNCFLAEYRSTAVDATEATRVALQNLLRRIICAHVVTETPRFVDKSQIFSIKLPLIHTLLQDCNPKYILVLRNPYTMCAKAIEKWYGFNLPIADKFELACSHYANTFKTALEDIQQLGLDTLIFRFEDFLASPEKYARKICNYVELEFDTEMLPQPHHSLPFGTWWGDKKWFPLRNTENEHHEILDDKEHVSIIEKHCGSLAEKFDYTLFEE